MSAAIDIEREHEDLVLKVAGRQANGADRELPPIEAYADDDVSHDAGDSNDASHEKHRVESLEIEPASAWAERDPPPERDNVIEALAIYAGRVSLFTGNGGFGKTSLAMQMLVACAVNAALYGCQVRGGTALGLFCEDEQADCERRVRSICAGDGIALSSLDRLHVRSLDGEDNVMCMYVRDRIVLTDRYWQIDATFERLKPRLAVLDTVADLFAGDFMSTPHVRQFLKIAIGGLAARHGSAIVLLAHPSQAAMNSGDGGGFSVAWNNSVRSRLYLRRPKSSDDAEAADRRVLEVKKSNYGPSGATIPLVYERGRFCVDPAPLEEGSAPVRIARTDTKLALAVMNHFTAQAPTGSVVMFRGIFEGLQRSGDIPAGAYETVRKPLQRALKALVEDQLLVQTDVPRGGYRLNRPTETRK